MPRKPNGKKIAMARVDDVTVRFRSDTTDLDKARNQLDQTGRSFGEMEKKGTSSFKRIEGALKNFGAVMLATFSVATVINFGRSIEQLGKQFTSTMSRVQALTKATGAQFEQLEGLAKQLGETTQFSAVQASEAMVFLAQAGFNTNQILKALPGTLQLAAAGQLDLATSADIATNVLSAYSLEADNLNQINDLLVSTTSKANTNIVQFAEAFKVAGPIAQSAGLDINEVAAIIGTLGNAGIQGSLAGTALRGSISSLIKPTAEAQKVLDRLGITTKGAGGELLPLSDIFKQLSQSSVTASDFFAIFGERAASAASVLTQAGGTINTFADTLKNDVGIAANIAAQQMDNLTGDSLKLTSAIEGQMLKAFEAVEPILRAVTQALTVLISNSKEITLIIASGAFIQLAAQWGNISKAIRGAAIAQRLFNTVSKANPFGLIVSAAMAAVTAIVLYKDELRGAKKAADDLTESQKKFNEEVAQEQAKLDTLIRSIRDAAKGSNERKVAIQQLNKDYGKYIGFLVTEETTLEDLAIAQEKANKALISNIALKSRQAELESLTTKLIENERNALGSLSGLQIAAVKDFINEVKTLREQTLSAVGPDDEFTFSRLFFGIDPNAPMGGDGERFEKFRDLVIKTGLSSNELQRLLLDLVKAQDDYSEAINETNGFYDEYIDVLNQVNDETSTTATTTTTATEKQKDALDILKEKIGELERQLILQSLAGDINNATLSEYLDLTNQLKEAQEKLKGAIEQSSTAIIEQTEEFEKANQDAPPPAWADQEMTTIEKVQKAIEYAQKATELFTQFSQERIQAQAEAIEASFQKETRALNEQLQQGLITQERYEAERLQLERETDQARREIQVRQAKQEKGLRIAGIILDTAAAVVKAALTPPAPNLKAAAAAGFLGAAQLAIANAVQIPEFAEGVIGLQGPGTETSDSITAKLSRGESVMTAAETKAHRPVLEAIRNGSFDKEYISMKAIKGRAIEGDSIVLDTKEQNRLLRQIIASNEQSANKIVSGLKQPRKRPARKKYGV